MRVWDFPPNYLCDKHLLAQHNEIHTIYSVIINRTRGFANHPEVSRWRGKLKYLRDKHEETSIEMFIRHFNHKSEFPTTLSTTISMGFSHDLAVIVIPPPELWQSISDQMAVLKAKSDIVLGCNCYQKLKEAGY